MAVATRNRPRAKTFPVIEIFGPTIQGEGAEAGVPTHFVRLGGCDYRCSWCDTMYAVDPSIVRATAQRLSVGGDRRGARPPCGRAAMGDDQRRQPGAPPTRVRWSKTCTSADTESASRPRDPCGGRGSASGSAHGQPQAAEFGHGDDAA